MFSRVSNELSGSKGQPGHLHRSSRQHVVGGLTTVPNALQPSHLSLPQVALCLRHVAAIPEEERTSDKSRDKESACKH